jgi:hypothetical protein
LEKLGVGVKEQLLDALAVEVDEDQAVKMMES